MQSRETVFLNEVYTPNNRMLVEKCITRIINSSGRYATYHEQVDDMVQATFLDAWKGFSGFRRESKVQTWLYRIAVNVAMKPIRKDAIRLDVVSRKGLPLWMFGREYASPYRNVVCREAKRRARRALRKLSVRYLRVMNLRFREELSFKEVADVMDSTEATMKNVVLRAKQQIRREIEVAGVTV